MNFHRQREKLPYRQAELFAMIADVERYPEFLPWCCGARIDKREVLERAGPDAQVVSAWLEVGIGSLREAYLSRVSLFPEMGRIEMRLDGKGPLHDLKGYWKFDTDPTDHGTWVDLEVNAEFRSGLLNLVARHLRDMVINDIASAFSKRACAILTPIDDAH